MEISPIFWLGVPLHIISTPIACWIVGQLHKRSIITGEGADATKYVAVVSGFLGLVFWSLVVFFYYISKKYFTYCYKLMYDD